MQTYFFELIGSSKKNVVNTQMFKLLILNLLFGQGILNSYFYPIGVLIDASDELRDRGMVGSNPVARMAVQNTDFNRSLAR